MAGQTGSEPVHADQQLDQSLKEIVRLLARLVAVEHIEKQKSLNKKDASKK